MEIFRAGLIPREPFPIDYRRYPLAAYQYERKTGRRYAHYSPDKQWEDISRRKAVFSVRLSASPSGRRWLDPPLLRRQFCEFKKHSTPDTRQRVLTNTANKNGH
jgi:hypothetical protein